jgi:hypothetical protein
VRKQAEASGDLQAIEAAEQLAATARRKEAYEAMHPETKAHVAGGMARQGAANDNLSFAADTAAKTGVNKRTVERNASRGEARFHAAARQDIPARLSCQRTVRISGIVPAPLVSH